MDLLRITSNPSSFDQDEKNFYFDQQSLARKMAVSKDVDEEHVKSVAEQCILSKDLADKEQMERDFIEELSDNELSFLENTRPPSLITRPQSMFLKIDQEWFVVPNLLLKLECKQNFMRGL